MQQSCLIKKVIRVEVTRNDDKITAVESLVSKLLKHQQSLEDFYVKYIACYLFSVQEAVQI